jgi:tetratricopeptide (TPR) repeat protein
MPDEPKICLAQRAQRRGKNVDIISEWAFLELIGKPCVLGANRSRIADAAKHLECKPDYLRRLIDRGLIQTDADGLLPRQELDSVRQVLNAAKWGVGPGQLRRKLDRIRGYLPGTATPLRQVELLLAPDGSLAFSWDDVDRLTDGQMLLGFDPRPEPSPIKLERGMSRKEVARVAVKLHDSGDLPSAIVAYEELAQALAPSHGVLYNLAVARRDAGDSQKAIDLFATVLRLWPRDTAARLNLASLHREAGRWSFAVHVLREGLLTDPLCADLHHSLAGCCEHLGDLEIAATHWERYSRLDPTSRWGIDAARRAASLRELLSA